MSKPFKPISESITISVMTRSTRVRLGFLSVFTLAVWLLIMAKLFWIQVINHEDLLSVRDSYYNQEILLEAERGVITDRNGTPLTMNLPHFDIGAHPTVVENPKLIAKSFSELFGKPESYYSEKLSSGKNFVWMERKVAPAAGLNIIARDFKGISAIKQSKRYYPYGDIGAQTIGFTDVDNLGIEGIEKSYDDFLRGVDGRKIFQIDGKGRDISGLLSRTTEPVPGGEVRLTIDLEYQTILQEELNSAYLKTKADRVTGILLQPQTGDLLAVGSAPGFTPNDRTSYPVANFRNSAITDTYEPGSTFKIVTATAAIANNLYTESDLIFCENGKINIANVSITDHKPYGWLTFEQVFYNSSNVGVIKIAQNVGRAGIFNTARAFGFGTKTGISLDGEATGILREMKKWSHLSLAEIAIGYEVSVSPLQLAMAYAAAANGGYLLRPRIILSATSGDGTKNFSDDVNVIRRVMEPETAAKLKELLLGVVAVGTGKKAYIEGFRVAGKSGTSQKLIDGKYSNEYYASFVAFLPADDPKLLCLVMVDNPRTNLPYGGEVAAPVVKNIFTRIANSNPRLITPKPPKKIEKIDGNKESRIIYASKPVSLATVSFNQPRRETRKLDVMPDITGLSLRAALKILGEYNLNAKFSGGGVVLRQNPAAGKSISAGNLVLLTMENAAE